MPLKKRWESTDSKLCGVEIDFSKDVSSLLTFNIDNGGFDFVLAPLMNPSYRPSSVDENSLCTQVHQFAGSDLVVSPQQLIFRLIGKISSWIDLDSENEIQRTESEIALKQEIAWAKHLSLRSYLLPTPKRTSCTNYARCVNQILQELKEMELWLRIPLRKDEMYCDSENPKDFWEIWNSFRLLCDHNSKLSVALDIQSILPSTNSLDRWFGESVKAVIISTECFIPVFPQRSTNLLASREELITRFFHHSVQVIISGKPNENTEDMETHPHKPYLDYLRDLFCKMEPVSELSDLLDTPVQPLKDNLNAHSYEMIEADSVKYTQYQRAIAKALEERVSEEKASELTTVLMVVGAGRGHLVKVSLQAAEETGRKLKVYAVEKNPYAVIALHDLVKMKGWEGTVTIICKDMRVWNAPEKADILVSELLGSFGDNELSPECLDGAQRFLKPNGISIPSSYTSFIQPITTSTLYNTLKTRWKPSNHAAVYLVNLHSVAKLAPCQPVFTFKHPNSSTKPNNQRYTKLRFNIPKETGSALVHGFAGYFEVVLHDDVRLSTEPTTATPDLIGWLPLFFPLMKPVEIHSESPLEAHFWRCSDSTKVWYEWTVSLPTIHLPIHNSNGKSYSMGLRISI